MYSRPHNNISAPQHNYLTRLNIFCQRVRSPCCGSLIHSLRSVLLFPIYFCLSHRPSYLLTTHTEKYTGRIQCGSSVGAHYKLLVCIAIYNSMLCSICTINYIAWPSIVNTQRSYKLTSQSANLLAQENEQEKIIYLKRDRERERKRSRVLDCVRGRIATMLLIVVFIFVSDVEIFLFLFLLHVRASIPFECCYFFLFISSLPFILEYDELSKTTLLCAFFSSVRTNTLSRFCHFSSRDEYHSIWFYE